MIRNDKKFIPVMLMPFQEDETIDYRALDQLVDLYLNAGASGLFANCLSSEMFNLSKEEMLKSVSFIVNKVNGRVPIVATGTFKGSIEEQAQFVKDIYATGIDCVIVITSLLAEENDSDTVFEQNVEKLLSLTDQVPLGFYECPVPYKRVIAPEFLGKVVKTGRVQYHKDTSLDINSIRAKIAGTIDTANFGLYDAYMVHAVESLKAGAAGLSCIQGNYFPELIVWLCDNYSNASKAAEVQKVQQFMIDQMDVMHYAYPATAKYYLQQTGFDINTICRRKDIEELDEATKNRVQKLKADYEKLSLEIFSQQLSS